MMDAWDFIDIFQIEILIRYNNKKYYASLDNDKYKLKNYESSPFNTLFSGFGDSAEKAVVDYFRRIKEEDLGIFIDKIVSGKERFYKLPKNLII